MKQLGDTYICTRPQKDFAKAMSISFKLSQLDRMDAIVERLGARTRSDFVRDAVEEHLKKFEQEKSENK